MSNLTLNDQPCQSCGGTGHGKDAEPEEVGWGAQGWLPPGKLDTERAVQAIKSIASAYGVPLPSVAVEGPPTGEYDRFTVRVYRRNPLQDRHDWPGPSAFDPETGIAKVGVYADIAPVLYRFYRRNSGPVHDMISGCMDAGKSRFLDQLLSIERSSPLMTSVVIDPQRGQSLPEWKQHVAHFARSAEEGVEFLLRLEQLMYQRNEILSNLKWRDERGRWHEGIDFFDPLFPPIAELDMKLVCITIDEAHAVLAYPEGVRAAESVAKMGRKCGKKLRLATQLPILDQLGGSSTLKDQVNAGNIMVLRTASRLHGDLALNGALPVDPVLLPREWADGSTTAGIGFSLGVQARPAQMRLYFPGDTYAHARRGDTTPLELPTRERSEPQPAESERVASEQPSANGARPTVQGTARERIVALLHERGPDGASVGVISDRLGMPMSTAATALKEAQQAGQVVQPRKRGPWMVARG